MSVVVKDAVSDGKLDTEVRSILEVDAEVMQRRLDAFARLLACKSMCVAICIIDGVFNITLNELKDNSRETRRGVVSIKYIYAYFSDLAKDIDRGADRKKIFTEICAFQRLSYIGITRSGLPIPQDTSTLLTMAMKESDITTLDAFYNAYKYEREVPMAFFIYGLFRHLYRDFCKLEKEIMNKKIDPFRTDKDNDDKMKFMAALKRDPLIYHKESESNVHAEVQLLSKIVSNYEPSPFNQTYYIGISRLCCLHCRTMIEAANLHSKNAIEVITRGKHDMDFKWICPDLFSDGYETSSKNPAKKNLAYMIGFTTKKRTSELLEQDKTKGNQEATLSDSGSDNEEEPEVYLQVTSATINRGFLEKVQSKYGNILDISKIFASVDTAEKIANSNFFEKMVVAQAVTAAQTTMSITKESIIVVLNSLSKDIGLESSVENVLRILQDDLYFSETIFTYFKQIRTEDLKIAAEGMKSSTSRSSTPLKNKGSLTSLMAAPFASSALTPANATPKRKEDQNVNSPLKKQKPEDDGDSDEDLFDAIPQSDSITPTGSTPSSNVPSSSITIRKSLFAK